MTIKSAACSGVCIARTVGVPARWKVKSYGQGLRIGELAERSGLTAKTLRFYEQARVLPEPGREKSGHRDYDEDAVARLAFVKAAQAAGLTLSEIRRVIAVRRQEGAPRGHVATLLDAHAAELDRRIADLMALRDQVLRLRERSTGRDPSQCSATTVCDVIPGPTAPAARGAGCSIRRPGSRRRPPSLAQHRPSAAGGSPGAAADR